MRKLVNATLCISAILGGLWMVWNEINTIGGNVLFAVLPLLYGIAVMPMAMKVNLWQSRYKFTLYMVVLLQWARCVALPVAGSAAGTYVDVVNGPYFNTILLLMCLELAVSFALCYYLAQKTDQETPSSLEKPSLVPTFHGGYGMYVLFAIAVFAIYWTFARNEQLFSFILLDTEERVGDDTDSRLTLIRTLVSTALTFLALSFIHRCYTRYESTQKERYVTWAVLVACLMLCIIIGERRSRQVYLLFAYAVVLLSLFPRHRKRLMTFLLAVGGLVLVMMSVYKFFNAFLYDSYWEAMQNADTSLDSNVRTFDSYFFGLHTMNKNMVYAEAQTLPFTQFFADIGRNVFGVHYLFSGVHTTSELYNLYLYSGEQATGYLMSSAGYGYLFFGYLAPLLTAVNIGVSAFLERCMTRARTVEFKYTFAIVYMRFSFGMFSSFPALLNSASRTLVINAVVIFCAGLVAGKRASSNPLQQGKGLRA